MQRFRPHRPSPAIVVALLALFVAMGGVGYAALKLPKNSVGSRQIKKNAVTSSKVKDGSLLAGDFKSGQLPTGQQGPQGTQGAKGDIGPTGPTGAAGPFPDRLASGKTVRGLWGHAWTAPSAGVLDNLFYSYGGFSLSAQPTPHYIPAAGAAPNGCTGGSFADPKADPGNLCVYELDASNVTTPMVCSIDGCPGSEKLGFQIATRSSATGTAFARGSWAATAP